MESLEEIEGAILEAISTSEATYVDAGDEVEPLQVQGCSLAFDLGWFVIENPYSVIGSNEEKIELNKLVGQKVKSAYSTKDEIRLNFESGSFVSVSMKDEDFVGPEAANYSPKRGEIIVFN